MTVFHHRLEDLIDQVPKVKLEIVGRYQMLDAAVQAVTDHAHT